MRNEYANLFRFSKCSLWQSDVLILQFESLSETTSKQISNSALEEEERRETQPAVCRSCGSFSVLLGRGCDNICSADSMPTLGPLIHKHWESFCAVCSEVDACNCSILRSARILWDDEEFCEDDEEVSACHCSILRSARLLWDHEEFLPNSSRFQKEMNFPYQEEPLILSRSSDCSQCGYGMFFLCHDLLQVQNQC